MSDSDEPQVIINSDSDESDDDRYDDDETDDDVEEDVVDNDDAADDDDEDDEDDDDYDDGDLMKSVIHNTETKREEQKTNNNIAKTETTTTKHIPIFQSTSSDSSSKAKTIMNKYKRKNRKLRSSYQILKKRSVKFMRNKFKRDEYKTYLKDVFDRLHNNEFSDSEDDNDNESSDSSLEIVDDDEEEEKKPQCDDSRQLGRSLPQMEQHQQMQLMERVEQREHIQPIPQVNQREHIQPMPQVEQREHMQSIPQVEPPEHMLPTPQIEQPENILSMPQLEQPEKIQDISQIQQNQEMQVVPEIEKHDEIQAIPSEVELSHQTQPILEIPQKQPIVPIPQIEQQQILQIEQHQQKIEQQFHPVPTTEQRQSSLPMPHTQPFQFIVSSVVGGVAGSLASQPPSQSNIDTPKTAHEMAAVTCDKHNMPKENAFLQKTVHQLTPEADNKSLQLEVHETTAPSIQPPTESLSQTIKDINPAVQNSADIKMEHTPTTSTTPPPSPASKTPLNLYKEINGLFPKYNKILTEHVEKCDDGDTNEDDDPLKKSIDENMLQLANDIKTINGLIREKELEWNRLLHLKRIKEEIIERLQRAKQKIDISKKVKGGQNAKSLRELKELEEYLGYTNSPYSIKVALNGNNNSTSLRSNVSSVAHIINNRASMNKEELLHENSIIDGLQKFLEKSKYLTKVGKNNQTKSVNKVLPAMPAESSTEQGYKMDTGDDCPDSRSQNFPVANKKLKVVYHQAGETAKVKTNIWEEETRYRNSKRKHMEMEDNLNEVRVAPEEVKFVQPKRQNSIMNNTNCVGSMENQATLSTMKRKYFQIDDDDEPVREYFPRRKHYGKGTLLNTVLLNGHTTDLQIQFGAAQHSTPRPNPPKQHYQASNSKHYRMNKDTYSLTETVNHDNTIVFNGNDDEREYEQYEGEYVDDQYWNGNAYANEDDFTSYKRAANSTTKPKRNFVLNGRHHTPTNGIDFDLAMPICHECNINESRIACSGCLNQWYCSRECQMTSWKHHSQVCRK